ncbi:MAG: valine--tRNA ligase [Ginsengibacter sp.]
MELSKNYDPAPVEDKWYEHWKKKGYFKSLPDERKPYTIVIPPPNVTGVLHMGHTLNETIQDVLIRRARMHGFNACWVPGSDHASIATEAKVVGMLKEKGIDKKDLFRDEFLKYAFEWKEKYGSIIYGQIARLGCSVDWDRVSFTMDPGYTSAVLKVFTDLYKKGLIYRGARMIHWDPSAKTALSDEEVEYRDVNGKLYYIKYFLGSNTGKAPDPIGSGEFIVIATQRPETIMGDTAVCANPGDNRYTHLQGREVIVPLINKRVPVIFDDYVDKDFGTGILKITPAHDINDYNIGLKHQLAIIDTLNEDGKLSEAAQIYVGEDRFVARKKIVEDLRNQGLLVKEEEYQTRLGFSQRTNSIAEPKISTQWFVKMKQLAEPALQTVLNGEVSIHPGEKFLATYKYWLENVKDWCISRQLWWGQRIPAWYDRDGNVFVAEDEQEAKTLYYQKKGMVPQPGEKWECFQDEDVLDTWFSSWLWPIELFKGITNPGNKEISYYYPTSVLVTGQDIIFFWVARMIMAGMEFMHEKPFRDVYFTGMVRDKQGRKMSKSLGNSPDLLQLIEKYGADAVRFGIVVSSPAGNDLLFDEASLEQGKHFNNKLWNALKLVKMWSPENSKGFSQPGDENKKENFPVLWFAERLKEVKDDVEKMFGQFRISEALKTIYSLVWDDFCSWYLEWVKPLAHPGIGDNASGNSYVISKTIDFFEQLLQLLHPFMPFITEEMYHLLRDQKEDLIIKQFEKITTPDKQLLKQGALLKEVITSIREAKIKNQLKLKEKIQLVLQTDDMVTYSSIGTILSQQVYAESFSFTETDVSNAIPIVVKKDKIYLVTDRVIDQTAQKDQMLKDLAYHKGFLNSVEKKLNNERFVLNAKADVIELERKKKLDAETKIKVIEESLLAIK